MTKLIMTHGYVTHKKAAKAHVSYQSPQWKSNEQEYHFHPITDAFSSSFVQFNQSAYKELLLRQQGMVQFMSDRENNKKYYSCRFLLLNRGELVDSSISTFCQLLLQQDHWHETSKETKYSNKINNTQILYYNPLPHVRYICGNQIKPRDVLVLNEACHEPSRLFPSPPGRPTSEERIRRLDLDRNYSDLDPIILSYDYTIPANATLNNDNKVTCEIPCFLYGQSTHPTINYRYIQRLNSPEAKFKLLMCVEGEAYYEFLKINSDSWKQDNFYSTTSYKSEIPIPYLSFSRDGHEIKNDLIRFEDKSKAAAFVASNCNSLNNREVIVKDMIKNKQSFRVDSLGKCLHNANVRDVLPNLSEKEWNSKVDFLRHYMFNLAFENQCTPDYITEKIWHAFVSGTIPVYYGASNIKEHVPSNSIILFDDFCYPEYGDTKAIPTSYNGRNCNVTALNEYLSIVAHNKTLHEYYHAWRKLPLSEHLKKFDYARTTHDCRQCRWGFARFYGLGWSHEEQAVKDVLNIGVTRDSCIDETTGFIHTPFRETWIRDGGGTAYLGSYGSSGCTSQAEFQNYSERACAIDSGLRTVFICSEEGAHEHTRIKRTVLDQDGVIDMVIGWDTNEYLSDALVPKYVLQIKTMLNNKTDFFHVEPGRYVIQDDNSRLSILTWPFLSKDSVLSPDNAILNIHVSALPMRLRFISENIDTFHKGAYMYDNFFGSLMAQDFYFPVEPFVAL